MSTPITVFEDPWPNEKAKTPLYSAAAQHLEIIEIFLTLLPYFKHDNEGKIHNEALAYSEWRYISYLRFLYLFGVAPNDCPPPWDVAIIWYCHLLSPGRFHRYLWDANYRDYGLNHHQFPLTHLLHLFKSGKWTHRKTQHKWDSLDHGIGKIAAGIPYQLWSSPPWETKRKSRLFSIISARKTSDKTHIDPIINVWKGGVKWRNTFVKDLYSLSEYTEFRLGKRPKDFLRPEAQNRRGELYELTNWRTLQDLRYALDRQVGFWRAAIYARNNHVDFVRSLRGATHDYERFIKLRERPPLERTSPYYIGEVEMDTIYPFPRDHTILDTIEPEYVPPTLAIDVLWHTHRLFPASYWVWSFKVAKRLVEFNPRPLVTSYSGLLRKTRLEWEKKYGDDCPTQLSMGDAGLDDYSPDAATIELVHPSKMTARRILGGLNPVKSRMRRTRGTYYVYDGVFVTFDGGGCDGGGGGGGGDGGGGDGGGGGGGDGGGGGGGGGD